MNILLIISCIVLIGYCLYMTVVNNKELPESISETSYISKNRYNTTLPFSILCFICAIGIFPLWVSISPENWQFLTFLSCGGMIFAGCTPLFKEEFESTIHYTSGIIAFISGLIWLCVTHNWLSISIICMLGTIFTLLKRKNYVFIFEIIGYLTIAGTLLFI